MSLEDSDGFQQRVLIVRGGGIALGHPGIGSFEDFGLGRIEKHALGLVAGPALRGAELIHELLRGHGREIGLLHARMTFGRDAPDAAMRAVAAGIGITGLVVTDDRIEPVGDIDCAIGTDADIDRAKRGG